MKKIFIISVLLLSISVSAQVKFDDYFTGKTMRVDYFHSGNFNNQYVVVDRIIEEPEWAGPRKNLTNAPDYGHFRFDIYDSTSNALIFSRGFSSLFAEWRNDPKAKEQCGNFSETMLFPFPKNTVNLVFMVRNKKNEWEQFKSFYINPVNDVVVQENPIKYDTEKIRYNGHPSEKLDIAFIAEGYTAAELDKFIRDCNRLADALFSIAPYNKMAKKINIWAVKSVSEESGVTIPTDNIFKNTAIQSSYNTFDIERYLMVSEHHILRDAAANVPYDQIYVIVNSKTYGGGGIYNFLSIGTADNIMAFLLLWHEFGHSFAGLADEYESDDPVFQNLYPADTEPWEPNISTLYNFAGKWQKMVKKNTPVPTPLSIKGDVVGVFEGAGYTTKGVYRPMKDCIMRSASTKKYCSVCEKTIEEAIIFYSK